MRADSYNKLTALIIEGFIFLFGKGRYIVVEHEYKFDPVTIEAQIELFEGTDALKKEVASIVNFPENKTPDVLFFSGIFVSSGANLNDAFFMPTEMVKAYNTIDNKALDIEHEETEIVGHIYSSAFIDRSGNKLSIEKLKDMSPAELDRMDLDVMIAGIIYKSRFPELAEEVKNNKWKLSMETYFSNYDVKVGNLILSRQEAEAMGLASDDVLGRVAKILKKGKEIAKGQVTRVLRNLLFSGCGLVKNPANPRSLILETAKKKGEEVMVVELEPIETELKDKDKEDAEAIVTSPAATAPSPDAYDVRTQTSPGICVNYKRRVIDATFEGPDAKVLHEDWCTLYDMACTSPSRGADHPECIRQVVVSKTGSYTKYKLSDLEAMDRRGNLLATLIEVLNKSRR